MGELSSNQIIEEVLVKFNRKLAEIVDSEVVFVCCPMAPPWDDLFRVSIENGSAERRSNRLAVLLETPGGYIETVERMVRVMRTHFEIVDFIVPNYAYSAGTVLALSGDDIYMDYHSVLGPIDPQYASPQGDHVPGMGYLAKYRELMRRVNEANDLSEVKAEVAFLVEKFDPAKLFHIEQAIEHSKTLLKEWLPKYKFKNWTIRESTGVPVNDADKKSRATEIAQALGDAEKWHSHGRGITCDDLDNDDIKLKIVNYGSNLNLKTAIRNYHGLLSDYIGKRSWSSCIHSASGFGGMQ